MAKEKVEDDRFAGRDRFSFVLAPKGKEKETVPACGSASLGLYLQVALFPRENCKYNPTAGSLSAVGKGFYLPTEDKGPQLPSTHHQLWITKSE